MLFDLYVPTRTHDRLEARVRSSSGGPVELRLGDALVTLEQPNVSYRGLHFFRHMFRGLPSGRSWTIQATQAPGPAQAVVRSATLCAPPGPTKLRVGLMADIHLCTERGHIGQYRPGNKRLYSLSYELAERYLARLEVLGAGVIVLLGDLVDPCTHATLGALREILGRVSVPCYPIIGNHEPWSPGGAALFHRELRLPEQGYYAVQQHGVRLVMLSTPSPEALHPGSQQFRWLETLLADTAPTEDVVLFSHFSLLLHPCVQGFKNDGYQLLDSHRQLLELICSFPNVRVFAAGHKNVPSMLVHRNVVHTLSPQLIQAPCAYDLLELYAGGVGRTTYEIDEQHYCEVARAAYASDWAERYGDEAGRNFNFVYPSAEGHGRPG
jgi:3',5'-cyclic AMP phosphodiesterase CpdA